MSSLLQLPRELRDETYKLILGSRMVHFVSEEISAPWEATIKGARSTTHLGNNEPVYIDNLCSERYVKTRTEQEAYDISQNLDLNGLLCTMLGLAVARCRDCRRHTRCARGWQISPLGRIVLRGLFKTVSVKRNNCMPLLQVSRTVYQDASAISTPPLPSRSKPRIL